MNRKHLGSSFSDSVKEWSKNPVFRRVLQEKRERYEMAVLLKEIREKEGFSQRQLAQLSSVPQPAIARIESMNSRVLPRLDLFTRLLSAMGYRTVVSAEKTIRSPRLAA